MSGGPRAPFDRWLWPAIAIATLLSIAGGWLFYDSMTSRRSFAALPESAREELAGVHVVPNAAAKVEQTWVGDFGTQDYLIAPVGALPCDAADPASKEALALAGSGDPDSRIDRLGAIASGDPANLTAALILGTEMIHAERYTEASRVMGNALARSVEDERIIRAARDPRSPLALGDADVATVIYLHHALGVAQLQQSGAGAPWVSLKNVIGSVKALNQRRSLGTTADEPTWSKLPIPRPGCATTDDAISTWDLYNNLIVGYMKGSYLANAGLREREFRRDTKAIPSAVHRLLVAQVEEAKKNGWKNESQLWALSNAEQVLDWRRPDDARLDVNAIRVIDFWLEPARCPKEICTGELRAALQETKDELLQQAFLRRNVTPAQQRAFAQTATRLLAGSGVDRAKIAGAAESMRAWLPAAQSATLADLIAADAARQKLPRELAGLAEPSQALARRGDAWREAAEVDFAGAAARWAKTRSANEQREVLIATRQLLGARTPPPAVVELESARGFGDRMRIRLTASKWAWALLAIALTLLVWYALLCFIVMIRDWRILHTSFYNAELEYLRKGEPPAARR